MDGVKTKILIVDDDNFLLDMYALKFSQNNFAVYTASNGIQAIEKLKEGLDPEIILSDIMMPEMDGFEMLEKVNKENLAPNALKLVLSNKNQQADVDRGQTLGVAGYIVKASSTPMEVIGQVKDILSAKMIKQQ
ncbi:MAG: response regulator [Candidatus Pacebacteria bacterium]|nr:response regulator [Candidatus Paceibacterota bacterium]